MSSAVKVLAVGSALGRIKDLFARVKTINDKHGSFAFVLCVGDFFGPHENDDIKELLDGSLLPPLPLYIMQGEHAFPPAVLDKLSSGQHEIVSNVVVLGLLTTPQNLRIGACGGGKYDVNRFKAAQDQSFTPFVTSTVVESILSQGNVQHDSHDLPSQSDGGLDILLTHLWPISISQHSPTAPSLAEYIGYTAPPLDDVVRRSQPRYHFATGGKPSQFWEREAFIWENGTSATRATRFINLGSFGEPEQPGVKKPRWHYAFSIAPGAQIMPPKPGKNPFVANPLPVKRPLEVEQSVNYIWDNVDQPPPKRAKTDRMSTRPPEGYKCRICSSEEHYLKDCPSKPEKAPVPEGYVCKRCGGADHLIRDCPKKYETGDTGGKKPREGYVCRACGSSEHYFDDCHVANTGRTERGVQRRRGPPREIAPDECWFCLSNPRVTKHLIVSIGSECYLTLPKGQLPPTGSRGSSVVPGGGHVLIVPISHYPTLASVPQDLALPIITEIEKYKSALRAVYAEFGASPVIFEVSRLSGKGGHAHVQVVPVPNSLIDQVEGMFRSEGERLGILFEANPSEALETAQRAQENFFRVDLPDGRMMVHLLRQGSAPFDLQFGRAVLANILSCPERLDWKACAQTDDEERADAQAFKKAMAPFDPMR